MRCPFFCARVVGHAKDHWVGVVSFQYCCEVNFCCAVVDNNCEIRAPWSESLSLNIEVNICLSVSFVPLQIIMRTLFWFIICTFCYVICYVISLKCWIFQNPMVFPPWFFGFYGVPTYLESYNFFACDLFLQIYIE